MIKRFLLHLFLFSIILMCLTVGSNCLGVFGKSKDSQSSAPPPLESKLSGSAGMGSMAAAYSDRAAQLKEKYQPVQQQERAQQPASISEEVVPEKKQSIFERAKAKAKSVRAGVKGGFTDIKETVARKVLPEEQLKKDISDGILDVVASNSGKIVNSVVDALRGIKVFPPVTQGVSSTLTNFRDEFGKAIGFFGVELGGAIIAKLNDLGVFAKSESLEITSGRTTALAGKMKLETMKEKPKSLFGRIKTAISDVFKSKSDVALVRIQNAISGCQNDLSDDLIQNISALLLPYLQRQYGSTISSEEIEDLINIPLRGVIYNKTSDFKDIESRKLVDFLRSQGVLK